MSKFNSLFRPQFWRKRLKYITQQVVTRQLAISFSNSFYLTFNRALTSTFDVRFNPGFQDQYFLLTSSASSVAGNHQYRGISGSIRSDHASMPPFMEPVLHAEGPQEMRRAQRPHAVVTIN